MRTVCLLLLNLLWSVPVLWSAEARAPELKVGDAFPNLAEYELDGDLPEGTKGKFLLIDFWASWCGPCKGTFPLLSETHRKFSSRGLVIVAVNEDRSKMAMKQFLAEYPVSFTVVRDTKKKLAVKVNVPSLPRSYLVGPDGKILLIQSGESMVKKREEFLAGIERALKNTKTAP